jgi:hypothetical protein
MMMDYARMDPTQAAALVSKAVAIAPDDPDVRLENARVLVRQGKSADAVRSLQGMKDLDRQQIFDLYQVAANAYLQLDRLADARQAAALVAQSAEEGAQADFAKRLAKSIDDYAAQRSVFEQRASGSAVRAPAQSGTGADGVRPSLATAAVSPGETLVTVAGRIRNIACQNDATILEVVVGDSQTLRLLVDAGSPISVVAQPGFQFNPACGPLDRAVTVSYKPGVDAARKTAGSLRLLDFRKQP